MRAAADHFTGQRHRRAYQGV